MSGEVRRLRELGDDGVLATVVDGLHAVSEQLADVPYVIVGGLAVLVHVQGHRVTEDIDSAIRGRSRDVDALLGVIAERTPGRDRRFVMPSGVPIDVLQVRTNAPRRGIGARREAKAHALQWALDTAVMWTLDTQPESPRGPVTVPVAEPGPLIAMKCIATKDPRRGDKRATDLLDIWRLLTDDPVATVGMVEQLTHAPGNVRGYVHDCLRELFENDPRSFVADMAGGPGAAVSVEDIEDLWSDVVGPSLRS